MKKPILSQEERKERKKAYDKQYRDRKKGIELVASAEEVLGEIPDESQESEKKDSPIKASKKTRTKEVSESFEKTFEFPVRLYWNMRMEKETSSFAKAGTPLFFEEIKGKGEEIKYRVRRGKRNFFTTPVEIKTAE
jgi:hypothetical protein